MSIQVNLPATVSQYAEAALVSKTTVRNSIAAGTLKVDEKIKPTTIIEGELAWTIDRWRRELEPMLRHIKPHMRGFDSGGNLEILIGSRVVRIERGICQRDLINAILQINRHCSP